MQHLNEFWNDTTPLIWYAQKFRPTKVTNGVSQVRLVIPTSRFIAPLHSGKQLNGGFFWNLRGTGLSIRTCLSCQFLYYSPMKRVLFIQVSIPIDHKDPKKIMLAQNVQYVLATIYSYTRFHSQVCPTNIAGKARATMRTHRRRLKNTTIYIYIYQQSFSPAPQYVAGCF